MKPSKLLSDSGLGRLNRGGSRERHEPQRPRSPSLSDGMRLLLPQDGQVTKYVFIATLLYFKHSPVFETVKLSLHSSSVFSKTKIELYLSI
jgi:hypothetical protein